MKAKSFVSYLWMVNVLSDVSSIVVCSLQDPVNNQHINKILLWRERIFMKMHNLEAEMQLLE